MKKEKTINGIYFQGKRFDIVRNGKSDILDLYSKPSNAKKDIFNYWEKKLTGVYGLIGGSHFFSIFGRIVDENGARYDVKITPSHNYYRTM